MTTSSESEESIPIPENTTSDLPTKTSATQARAFYEVDDLDCELADLLHEGSAVYLVRIEYEDRPTVDRQFALLKELRDFLASLIGSRAFVSMSVGLPLHITNTYPPQLWTPAGTIPLLDSVSGPEVSPDGFMGSADSRPHSRGYYPPAEDVEEAEDEASDEEDFADRPSGYRQYDSHIRNAESSGEEDDDEDF